MGGGGGVVEYADDELSMRGKLLAVERREVELISRSKLDAVEILHVPTAGKTLRTLDHWVTHSAIPVFLAIKVLATLVAHIE